MRSRAPEPGLPMRKRAAPSYLVAALAAAALFVRHGAVCWAWTGRRFRPRPSGLGRHPRGLVASPRHCKGSDVDTLFDFDVLSVDWGGPEDARAEENAQPEEQEGDVRHARPPAGRIAASATGPYTRDEAESYLQLLIDLGKFEEHEIAVFEVQPDAEGRQMQYFVQTKEGLSQGAHHRAPESGDQKSQDDSDGSVVGFGKHCDMTYADLLKQEPEYCSWILDQYREDDAGPKMAALAEWLIAKGFQDNSHGSTAAGGERLFGFGPYPDLTYVDLLRQKPKYCAVVLELCETGEVPEPILNFAKWLRSIPDLSELRFEDAEARRSARRPPSESRFVSRRPPSKLVAKPSASGSTLIKIDNTGPYKTLVQAKLKRQRLIHKGGLKADEVGVFAKQVPGRESKGAMTFFVNTYEAFAHSLRRGDVFGEVLLEERPCWLYFDVEYSSEVNPLLEPEAVMGQFRWLLANFSAEMGVPFDESKVVYMNATRAKKVSFHVIVKAIDPFPSNYQAGIFVDAMLDHASGLRSYGHTDLLFAKRGSDDDQSLVPIIDTCVYSRNRVFRMLGQIKRGDMTSVLRLEEGGSVVRGDEPFRTQALETMASYVPSDTPTFTHAMFEGHTHRPERPGSRTVSAASVDGKWKRLAEWAIQRWDAERTLAEGLARHATTFVSRVEEETGDQRLKAKANRGQGPDFVTFYLENNRFCTSRGRSHKANGVWLKFNLKYGTFQQHCWDKQDCDYNKCAPKYPFPLDLVPDSQSVWSSYFDTWEKPWLRSE